MAEVGDRVMVEAEKVGRDPRSGVVTGVEGALIKVRWEGGGESMFVPASGSLKVVGRDAPRKRTRKK